MLHRSHIIPALLAATVLTLCMIPAARSVGPVHLDKVQMRDMTWPEIRAAVAAGGTTVIVPTGGIEQNGPHMVLAKHDHIVGYAATRIAESLGGTLVAPVVSFVPEGTYTPATGNLSWPGTIGISEQAFEQVLDGIARSLKLAGFTTIAFIGDHGQSQEGQAKVAATLSREWARDGVRVVQVDSYYDDSKQTAALKAEGETDATIGFHSGLVDTAELMAIYPKGVDLGRLQHLSESLGRMGGSGDPSRASAERGATLIAMRIAAAVAQMRALRGD